MEKIEKEPCLSRWERCHGYTVTERDIRSPIPVNLTTIEHPLFL